MILDLCILKPKGPLHLGEREGCLEGSEVFIHSDTLFSALCHALLLLQGPSALNSLLDHFLRDPDPPFLLSSCFPFWNGSFYFPLPLNQFAQDKQLKKVRFIEKSAWEKLLAGHPLESLLSESSVKTIPALPGSHSDETHGASPPYRLVNAPHIAPSRLNASPQDRFFHAGEVFYDPHFSFFFLIRYNDPADDLKNTFKAALRLLCDEGIGGERSSGKGLFFQPSFDSISLDTPANPNAALTLSTYFPQDHELPGIPNGYYSLLLRKGYIYSPAGSSLRRKSLRLFSEGSVFPVPPSRTGKLVNVTPSAFSAHNIFRYGFFFPIPCIITPEDPQ